MAFLRPWILFDTNICVEAAKSNGMIQPEEWKKVLRYCYSRYRYCVSWVTWKELLVKLSRGDDACWEQNRVPLKILSWNAKATYLEKPPLFALKGLLGIDASPRTTEDGAPVVPLPKQMRDVVAWVSVAANKDDLRQGIEVNGRNGRRLIGTFDLDHLDACENETQHEQANLLGELRAGRIVASDPTKLSAWLLVQCGLQAYTDHCHKLSSGLDAAYRYTFWLYGQAKNNNYAFGHKRHLGDWDDVQQLYYLSHKQVHLLTLDRDFVERTKGTSQAAQILLYNDFVRQLP